jgi:hypothetical protein
MAPNRWVELPEHVVAKIGKVVGIPLLELGSHDMVKLIEELRDTALMFDREARGARRTEQTIRPDAWRIWDPAMRAIAEVVPSWWIVPFPPWE